MALFGVKDSRFQGSKEGSGEPGKRSAVNDRNQEEAVFHNWVDKVYSTRAALAKIIAHEKAVIRKKE